MALGSCGSEASGDLDDTKKDPVPPADPTNPADIDDTYDFSKHWVNLGKSGFSEDQASNISSVITNDSSIYVAYSDYKNDGVRDKITVQKFNGTSWDVVGTARFSNGAASYISIVADSNNNIYVAYVDVSHSNYITVMKFDGTNWVDDLNTNGSNDHESLNCSGAQAEYSSMTIDSNDNIYVAFSNLNSSGKLVVMKYDRANDAWTYDLNANGDNESLNFSSGEATNIHLTVDSANNLYVLFSDASESNKLTVMKFDGTNWVDDLNSSGANSNESKGFTSDTAIVYSSIATDLNNNIYVAYITNLKLMVMIFDSTTDAWISDLNGDNTDDLISDTRGSYLQLKLDSNNNIYIAYRDYNNAYGLSVQKFNGNSWNILDEVNFADSTVSYLSLSLDSSDNIYLAYRDDTKHELSYSPNRISVLEYITAPAKPILNTYMKTFPNGANVSINFSSLEDTDLSYYYNLTDTSVSPSTGTLYDGEFDITGTDQTIVLRAVTKSSQVNQFSDYTVAQYVFKSSTDWHSLGNFSFSKGNINEPAIAKDSNNNIYVAYSDSYYQNKIVVKKFNGTTWEDLGTPGFSDGAALYIDLIIDSNDIVYVTYNDYSDGYKLYIQKFDGTNWTTDLDGDGDNESAAISTSFAKYMSFALDSTNKLYIAFQDFSTSNNDSTIMSFDGHDWNVVGSAGITTGVSSSSDSSDQILVIDQSTDIPYLAYVDGDNSDKITIVRYFGGSWTADLDNSGTADSIGISEGNYASSPSLLIDNSSNIYIAYTDNSDYGKITVMKFTSGSWTADIDGDSDTESLDITNSNYGNYISLMEDSTHGLHLIARTSSGLVKAFSFDVSDWTEYSEQTDDVAEYPQAIMVNDVPYVVYRYDYYGKKASVSKLGY